jgi:mannose-6-phosphate isomerase-like protein (cupin superfamily)
MTTIDDKARLLIHDIDAELKAGTKHYRLSDGQLLATPKDIIYALENDGSVRLEFPEVSK